MYTIFMLRLAIALGVSLCVSFAQVEIGGATLNGTITDTTGAAVPNVRVTATSTATGLTRTTQSTQSGLYSLTGLPVGTYDLSVESQGFKLAKRTSINLSVGAVATVDVTLEVGTSTETVSVTAEVPVVETTRSQTSTTVTSQQVRDLPINGRNFLDFTVLTPGVVRDPTRSGDLSF